MATLGRLTPLALFFALGALWLASFRIADALTFFKTYSSIWFLPTGVTMAIVMVAPGWLKLSPLIANLLLAFPSMRAALGVAVIHDYEPLLHGTRLFAIYGGAGYLLTRWFRIELPSTSLRDYQVITATTIAAVSLATVSGVGLHMIAGNMTLDDARHVVWSWWLGDAIGAFAVPPMLVPLLRRLFGQSNGDWHWPHWTSWLEQVGLILVLFLASAAMFTLSDGTLQLWPLLIVTPLLYAMRGGLPMSATSVFLTMVVVPVVAVSLSLHPILADLRPLLLTTTIAGLLLGAAMSDRQKLLREVEQIVDDRTQALREAHEFQRHLIRSIGHDVRQPIEGMNMLLDGLERRAASTDNNAAIRQTRRIGALASQLLSTILTYARFDAGSVIVQSVEFPVGRLFDTLNQLFAPFAELKNVNMVWRDKGAVLHTDEALLGQALSNLIDNALRLTEPGTSIEISVEPSADGLAIIVTDAASPTSTTPGAAGFGLGIVTKIANVLDAQIITEPNRRGLILPARQEEA